MGKRKKTPGRSYCLPVDGPRHTEVLGYRVSSKTGRHLWDQLDWSEWWLDGPGAHVFNAGGMYFHVRAVNGDEEVRYRVRCVYAGWKYRGREVTDIGIAVQGGKLHWIVRTK